MRRYMLFEYLVFSLVILVLANGCNTKGTHLPQADHIEFFSEEDCEYFEESSQALPPAVSRSRCARINSNALIIFELSEDLAEKIIMNLFEDIRVNVTFTSREATITGGVIIKGNIENAAYSEVTIVYQDSVITGGIAYEDQYFKIESNDGVNGKIMEISQSGFPGELQPLIP